MRRPTGPLLLSGQLLAYERHTVRPPTGTQVIACTDGNGVIWSASDIAAEMVFVERNSEKWAMIGLRSRPSSA